MIPTVNVTVAVHGQDGTPVRDALVFARLTTVERYNGYVVAGEYEGRTKKAVPWSRSSPTSSAAKAASTASG